MSVVRRYLVVPALARLIRKERGGSRITEGYFAPQGGRTSLVRIDGQQCHLVLINTGAAGGTGEERTEVPRAHGDALLDVCGGKAVYERTTLALANGPEALIDRYVTPTGLDLISVSFDDEQASKTFRQPNWFGPEVSDNAGYERHAIALQGVPEAPKMGLNNAMLDAVLDLIEPRFGLGRFGGSSVSPKPADNGAKPAPLASQPAPSSPPAAPTPVAPAAPLAEKPSFMDAKPAAEAPSKPAVPPPAPAEAVGPGTPANQDSPAPQAAKPEDGKQPGEPQPDGQKSDARIDDVIESLSQALGAAIQQPPEPAKSDDLAASFERWTVRPRRTQQ